MSTELVKLVYQGWFQGDRVLEGSEARCQLNGYHKYL